jgi:hypothetical protein
VKYNVRFSGMLDMSKKLEHIRKRMDQISKEFDHIRTTLDWDVKAKGNIDRTFRRIDNTIEDISDCLGDHNRFVVKAHDTYLESESALAALTGDSENTLFKDSVQEVHIQSDSSKGDEADSSGSYENYILEAFKSLFKSLGWGSSFISALFKYGYGDTDTADQWGYAGGIIGLFGTGCEMLMDYLRDGNLSLAEIGEAVTSAASKIIKLPGVKEGIKSTLGLAENTPGIDIAASVLSVISTGFDSYGDQAANGDVDGLKVAADVQGKIVTEAVKLIIKYGGDAFCPGVGTAASVLVDVLFEATDASSAVSNVIYNGEKLVYETGKKAYEASKTFISNSVETVKNVYSDCKSKLSKYINSKWSSRYASGGGSW